MEKYKVNLNIDVYVEAESFNDAVEKAADKVKLDWVTNIVPRRVEWEKVN